jgi:hypothetical protein
MQSLPFTVLICIGLPGFEHARLGAITLSRDICLLNVIYSFPWGMQEKNENE